MRLSLCSLPPGPHPANRFRRHARQGWSMLSQQELAEQERVKALHTLGVLDTPAEDRFDRFTRLAAAAFGVPIALVSLIDSERQWFKSRVGLDLCETPRSLAFCSHAI